MPIDVNTEKAVFVAKKPLRWIFPSILSGDEENSIMYNGHTVEISPSLGAYVFYSGKKYARPPALSVKMCNILCMYKLLQFHFHTPSENRIDGHAFASEVHLVHQAADGSLMVTSAAAACCSSLSRFVLFCYRFSVCSFTSTATNKDLSRAQTTFAPPSPPCLKRCLFSPTAWSRSTRRTRTASTPPPTKCLCWGFL